MEIKDLEIKIEEQLEKNNLLKELL